MIALIFMFFSSYNVIRTKGVKDSRFAGFILHVSI